MKVALLLVGHIDRVEDHIPFLLRHARTCETLARSHRALGHELIAIGWEELSRESARRAEFWQQHLGLCREELAKLTAARADLANQDC